MRQQFARLGRLEAEIRHDDPVELLDEADGDLILLGNHAVRLGDEAQEPFLGSALVRALQVGTDARTAANGVAGRAFLFEQDPAPVCSFVLGPGRSERDKHAQQQNSG